MPVRIKEEGMDRKKYFIYLDNGNIEVAHSTNEKDTIVATYEAQGILCYVEEEKG